LSPDDSLSYSVTGPLVVPQFLGTQDHPWLRVLLEERDRFVGRPQRELDARLREPLPCASPPVKLKLAVRVLAKLQRSRRIGAAVPPRKAREVLFQAAARDAAPPSVVLARVAAELGVAPRELEESLFADLPGEKLLAPSASPVSPEDLALRINLALVQGLLCHAMRVKIDVEGQTRGLVRHARLRGLICTVTERSGAGGATVTLSGPLALFRNTRLYGRALGEVVPMLAWCARFHLRAECVLEGRRLTLELRTGDAVVYLRRLLSFGADPIVVEEIWLPGGLFKGLTAERLAEYKGPLYGLFETEFGTRMIRADEHLRAVSAERGAAELLGVAVGAPLLLVERVSYSYGERPVEVRRGLYETTHYHYRNTLT